MYLLPCPQCQASIQVPPSQAGDEAVCSSCQAQVPIPTLGELRKLPRTDDGTHSDQATPVDSDTSGRQVASAILGMIALAGLLVGGFAAIRWFLIDSPINSEIHIAETEKAFEDLEAARLIREFQHMESQSLDLPAMFNYKVKELEKRRWGLTAAISGGLGAVAAAIAMVLASTGRSAKS